MCGDDGSGGYQRNGSANGSPSVGISFSGAGSKAAPKQKKGKKNYLISFGVAPIESKCTTQFGTQKWELGCGKSCLLTFVIPCLVTVTFLFPLFAC